MAKRNLFIIMVCIGLFSVFSALDVAGSEAGGDRDPYAPPEGGGLSIEGESSHTERLKATFTQYQHILESQVDLYERFEHGYIDNFLRHPNPRNLSDIPNLFTRPPTRQELKRLRVRLLDVNTRFNMLRYELSARERKEPLFMLVNEFSEFTNAQYEDYFRLKNRSYEKFRHAEGAGQPGMYGAHHMYQKKNKDIAEQSVLILERFDDDINYEELDQPQSEAPSVSISGILNISKTHLYKNIGWPS